jgi:Predicted membrane protein (DUF2306)
LSLFVPSTPAILFLTSWLLRAQTLATIVVIFGGALVGFSLARLDFLDLYGHLCPPIPSILGQTAPPSLCFWVRSDLRYRIGILLHIGGILPASILAVFQFLPFIRHQFILYHRVAGYTAVTLVLIANAGSLMIAQITMGGDLTTQVFIGFVVTTTTITMGLGIYYIKRVRLDQHRAWMLRTWFYLSFDVTLRLLQLIMTAIITTWPSLGQQAIISCAELEYIYEYNITMLTSNFPACLQGNEAFASAGNVIVNAQLGNDRGQGVAALRATYAATAFLALFLHAIGVEIYLWLTPREGERLRTISCQWQSERGLKISHGLD